MKYREIIAVCSQIHTKHKYTVWAERRFCNIEPYGSTQMNHEGIL
jgi:hypothetical protein